MPDEQQPSTQPASTTAGDGGAGAAANAETQPNPTETVDFWKSKAREWEDRSKANFEKAQKLDAIEEQSKTDLQRAQDEAQRLTESLGKARSRAVAAEAKALARDFANPDIAIKLLGDLGGFLSDEGDIDSGRLESELADLLQREPYLGRASQAAPPSMRTNPAQTRPSGDSSGPSLDQQIADATAKGDHQRAIALKQRKAFAQNQLS